MRYWILACVLVTPIRSTINAQELADRVMIAAWDDSVQRLMTVAQINQYGALAHAGKTEAKNLRLSLFQIRSAELRNNRPDIELGLDNLVADASAHPKWPWPDVEFARTFFRMEGLRRPILPSGGLKMAEPYLTGAWRHLELAINKSPNFGPAIRVVAEALVPGGDRYLRAPEVGFVRYAVLRAHPDPDLLLIWGRHLRTLRRYDSALKVFTRAVFEGGDYSRLALERARTLVAVRDSASAALAYWDGAEHMSPAGRELYRDDLSWIISADSLVAFDALPIDSVSKWLGKFWRERDAASANESGDRVVEQLRRWIVALSQFRTDQPWFRTLVYRQYDTSICGGPRHVETEMYQWMKEEPSMVGDPRSREVLVDHRGLVYLRHGEPGVKIGGKPYNFSPLPEANYPLPIRAGEVNYIPRAWQPPSGVRSYLPESWLYFNGVDWDYLRFERRRTELPTGAAKIFTRDGDLGGWWLKTFPVEDLGEMELAGRYVPEMAVAAAVWRASEAKDYGGSQLACPERALAAFKTRDDARGAIRTDTDYPPISEPWVARTYTYALGQSGDSSGKALITFAFGVKDLVAAPVLSNAKYVFPINIRVVAYQVATDRIITLDTLRNLVSNTRAGWVTGWLELPLPAGQWQIAFYAKQDSTNGGAYSLRRDVIVDQPASITLSDIVTGRSDAAPWKAPDGVGFPVNPVGVWPYQGNADLYYEVRGLTDGAGYQTTIQLRPRGSTAKPLLEIRTNDQATGPLTHVRKNLGLEKLPAGEYEVVVIVQANGKKAQRTAVLRISPP